MRRATNTMTGTEAQQGDVLIMRVSDTLSISTAHEIKPRDNRLILAEGELTGHHHAITLTRATVTPAETAAMIRRAIARRVSTARLYRDPAAVLALVRAGLLLRADLAIGFLVIEGGPVTLRHPEHDGIRLMPGRYYIGGQVESAGADERRVAD